MISCKHKIQKLCDVVGVPMTSSNVAQKLLRVVFIAELGIYNIPFSSIHKNFIYRFLKL